MSIASALQHIARREEVPSGCMAGAIREIMEGEAHPVQAGALLMGLAVRGETVAELTAAARVMRRFAVPVRVEGEHVLDTCGTGGDGRRLFNVSTACAFVCAEAGVKVAKHGNRSVSSSTGSADVLECAGVRLDLDAAQVAECINRLNIGFLYARTHHPAVARVAEVRRALGMRTLFNLLGPLTNPAGAGCQLLGVYDRRWLRPVAEVLAELGSHHVLVVHAEDGLDEISCAAPTRIAELREGGIIEYMFEPEWLLGARSSLEGLQVEDAPASLELIRQALQGETGAAADLVALNAAAGIYAAGRADSLAEGYRQARAILASGRAWRRLQDLAGLTRELAADR